jgi:hypothetical protein
VAVRDEGDAVALGGEGGCEVPVLPVGQLLVSLGETKH